MSPSTLTLSPAVLDRNGIAPHLAALDAWLLPGCFYGVQHTWPLLYRSDGQGQFHALFDGDRLVSHCATKTVLAHGLTGPFRCALLGSVATTPERRGEGLAGAVLEAAIAALTPEVEHILLWAERPDLYARHGFVPTTPETMLAIARRPRPRMDGVRLAEIGDHDAIHNLHVAKPWRIERTRQTMSGLLTTPGMTTVVLERDGAVIAYACTGKGADLQNTWHEFGGDDDDIAHLLLAAMHLTEQIEAAVLLPPYRQRLEGRLGISVIDATKVPGPMARSTHAPLPPMFVDGLDSV